MSPEERRLLTDLFERVRGASNTPRDREAEDLIAQKLREQPYAAYFLAQAVIIQDQALKASTDRIHDLEEQVQQLEEDASRGRPQAAAQSGGFLGSLGSLFGSQQPANTQAPYRDTSPQREGRLYDDYQRGNREPEYQPGPSPWGRAGAMGAGPWGQSSVPSAGGGFLRGALTTAAGVAGGVLVADAVRDMFSPHVGGTNTVGNGLFGNAGTTPVQETVNNYFINDDNKADTGKADPSGDGGAGQSGSGQADWGADDNDSNNDDDFDTAGWDDGDSNDDSYA